MSVEKKQIKVSEVLALLEQGQDRTAIRETLGLTHQEMASLFQHPKLKYKKPKTTPSFTLVDDTEEGVEETAPSANLETVASTTTEFEELGSKNEGEVAQSDNDGVASNTEVSVTEEVATPGSGVWQD